MLFETFGVVLKRSEMPGSDIAITVLTSDHGLIGLIASGAKRKGSALAMSSQLFAFGAMSFEDSGRYKRLKSFEPSPAGFMLGKDLECISYASYFSEIILATVHEEREKTGIYKILTDSFSLLTNEKYDKNMIRCGFELKLLKELGYSVVIGSCGRCSSKRNLNYFSDTDGGIICEDCYAKEKDAYRVGRTIPKLMTCMIERSMLELVEMKVAYEYLKKVQTICMRYYKVHLNIADPKSLEMIGMF